LQRIGHLFYIKRFTRCKNADFGRKMHGFIVFIVSVDLGFQLSAFSLQLASGRVGVRSRE
jgi:hypothetical protein